MIISTPGRKNNLLEHAQLLSAILARLILDVDVSVVVHQADPLGKVIKRLVQADAAPARVARIVELLVLKGATFCRLD